MPRARRLHRHRTKADFEGIGIGERTRWSQGQIIIEGEFTPVKHACASAPVPWASWDAWAETYALCRPAFIAWYATRHPGQEPGSELLFAAYQKGENPADVVIDRRSAPLAG